MGLTKEQLIQEEIEKLAYDLECSSRNMIRGKIQQIASLKKQLENICLQITEIQNELRDFDLTVPDYKPY